METYDLHLKLSSVKFVADGNVVPLFILTIKSEKTNNLQRKHHNYTSINFETLRRLNGHQIIL